MHCEEGKQKGFGDELDNVTVLGCDAVCRRHVRRVPRDRAQPVVERSNDVGSTFEVHNLLDEMRWECRPDIDVFASEAQHEFEKICGFLLRIVGECTTLSDRVDGEHDGE